MRRFGMIVAALLLLLGAPTGLAAAGLRITAIEARCADEWTPAAGVEEHVRGIQREIVAIVRIVARVFVDPVKTNSQIRIHRGSRQSGR